MENTSDILISIDPRHVSNILSGKKNVELRRRKLRVAPNSRIWIYSTLPHGWVGAVASVKDVVSSSPHEIWKRFSKEIAISRSEFDCYLDGLECCHAIVLEDVEALARTIKLNELKKQITGFHPPQFFKRLSKDSPELTLFENAIA